MVGRFRSTNALVVHERVYRRLEPERRAWLLWALLATDPEHMWIKQLAEDGLAGSAMKE
jgi:hypothetical protein